MQIRVEVEGQPSEEERRLIDAGLDEFNFAIAGVDHEKDLWVIARCNDGGVLGGLKGQTFYAWLYIDWLWVSPDARGHGVGAGLLSKAEDAARKRGCVGAHVDTFSFQAPGFYRQS